MNTATLAVELLTEELPPKALKSLGEEFARALHRGLEQRAFLAPGSVLTSYATPRRLAVTMSHVLARSPDQPVVQRLMPANVALDANGPTKALRKKLASMGREHLADRWSAAKSEAFDGPDRLYVENDGKSEAVFLRRIAAGQFLARGVEEALDEAIAALPIPKVMSYASPRSSGSNDVKFVRPAHGLLVLHGTQVLEVFCERLQLAAGRRTRGHRFLARRTIDISSADAYADALYAEGKVLPSFAERRARIVGELTRAGAAAKVIMPDALLDEVTALVEWPVVYAGTFDPAFLAVPQECLILTMQQNQKYFAIADPEGSLLARFLLVSNLETTEPSAIVHGNERVLRARLADAKFFYDQDRKTSLESRVPRLASIVYHNRMGSLLERTERIASIAREIATRIGADADMGERAARLAKADLLTDMVGEFPELQGLMGCYYARHDGEAPRVAEAIEQQYWPRFAGDALPRHREAQAVALADKLELMAGMFGIGAQPTGDKDPFGLRRAALGVLRMVIEKELPLALDTLLDIAFSAFHAVPAVQRASADLETFIYDRLRGYLREQGYTANQIAAVVDSRPTDIHLVPARLAAVQSFEAMPEAQTLSAANKRIVNILRKAIDEAAAAVDRARLAEGAERDLYLVFEKLEPLVSNRCAAGDYTGALTALATAKPAVDRFFDDVMVMADDPAVRGNRLALLRGVADTMNRVADISRLAV